MIEESKDSSRRLTALFYGLVLVGGITLYAAWGMLYGAWNIFDIDNIAIYSFFMVMVGTGLVGVYLYGGKLEIK
ncbi:MAG: hypothetical protein V1934_06495 [Methanobacteriota archaeon]